MRPEAVAENFAADLFLGKRQTLATVARAHRGGLLEASCARPVHSDRQAVRPGAAPCRGSGQSGIQRPADQLLDRGLRHRVLYRQDRLIEEAAQRLEVDAAGLGVAFRQGHVVGARQIAEEIALAHRQGAIVPSGQLVHLGHDPVDDLP